MTKNELQAKLKEMNVEGWNAKTPKAELEALIKAASKPQQKAAPTKRGPSTKAVIRNLFPKVGTKVTAEALFAACPTKAETVVTMIADLKNPKYAGKEGVIVITHTNGTFERTA